MARKDVNLVIKAKDEAGRVVQTLTASLQEFIDAQRGLDTQADKTSSRLGELGAAFGRLDKALGGLDVGGKFVTELESAKASLDRIQTEVEQTTTEFAGLDKKLSQAGSQLERYESKLAGATAAQERQRGVVAKAKADQTALSRAYNQAVTAQSKLAREQAKLPQQIARTSAAVAKSKQRFEELQAQILGTEKPTRTLTERFESAGRSLARNESTLAKLQGRYSEVASDLRAAGSAATIFEAQLASTNNTVARQQAALGKIGQNVEFLKIQTREAATAQTNLGRSTSDVTKKLGRQTQQLDQARQSYLEIAAAADKAGVQMREISAAGVGALQTELNGQRRAVLEAKREWAEYQARVKEAAEAIGRAGVPTAAMAEDLARLKIEARESKAAYTEQRQALELMGREFREAGTDVEKLVAAQQKIIGIQNNLRGKLQASAGAANQQRSALAATFAQYERGAAASQRLATATERSSRANRQGAASTRNLANAWQQFYGGSRQSLSLLQRLRGEVLSLAAAYGGLFGAINVLQQSVGAIQVLEGATARLTVSTGSAEGAERELDFLRRTADRLGISFGLLANEYSKFTIATQSSNISAQETRTIFEGIAESARVNRASTSQLSGVFTALTQIVSKGAVQQEELRQQLGDRLPGALQIMADSLGITTAELVKMTEQGELTERALIPFAEELRSRFSGGLDEAINSLTASLGKLSNAAFQALVKFADAGFADDFQELADSITETLKSADFEAFIQSAATAVGGLLSVLQFAVENIQLMATAITALVALKLSPFLVAVGGNMARVAVAAKGAAVSIGTAGTAASASTGAFTGMAVATGRLAGALSFLTKGSVVGLAITAIAAGLAFWSTEADKATEALVEHRKIVDEVKNAYDAAEGNVEKWQESLQELSPSILRANLQTLEGEFKQSQKRLNLLARGNDEFLTNFFGYNLRAGGEIFTVTGDYKRAITQVVAAWNKGNLSADEFLKQLEEVNGKFSKSGGEAIKYGKAVIEAAEESIELKDSVRESNAVLDAQSGSMEEVADAAEDLNLVMEDLNDTGFDLDKAADYSAAMDGLREIIDELIPKAEELETALEIEGAFEQAIANAQTLEERIDAVLLQTEALDALAQKTVDADFGNLTDATEITAAFLRKEEGFRSTPYYDVNAQRAGYGSDTITLADGTIKKITKGMRVSVEDANRDLIRRINQEFAPRVADQIGQANFDSLAPQQQAALTSIAYNSGSLPKGIVQAIRSGGTTEQIAAAIVADIQRVQSLPKLNENEKKVVSERRRREAALFGSTANEEALAKQQVQNDEQAARERQKLAEQEARENEKAAELAQRARESIAEGIEDEQFRQSLEKESLTDREVALALREAEKTAAAAGIELTEKERQQIADVTRAKYAKQEIDEANAATLERAQEAQRQLNLLEQEQAAIRTQLEAASKEGDTEKVEELKARLVELNEELTLARENAIAMWEKVGGQESATAIEQVRAGAVEAQKLSEEAKKTRVNWEQVGDLFVNGLVGAFDSFAQAVANGENAFEAARNAFLKFASDFLRQIATMILRAALFRALNGVFGGTAIGGTLGLTSVATAHTGGLVGSMRVGTGNASRKVDPSVFAVARRFHDGGLPGLKANEVPTILKKNEEVLTEDDPRNILNASDSGGSAPSKKGLKIVNAIAGSVALQEALATPEGEEVLVNYMRQNADVIKASLG